MAKMEALRSYFSEVSDIQVQVDGYALRLIWQGSVNPVVMQTLEDYGGFKLVEDEDQALWFFFSPDVLVAAARLGVWSRFNPLALGLQIFPARLIKSHAEGKQLITDEAFWQQEVKVPSGLRIWVNMAMRNIVETSPGLSVQLSPDGNPLDSAVWPLLEVDPRLPYQSPLSWFAVLRPVESAQDKAFHLVWREFLSHLEALLQRNKFRFSLHDNFLLFSIETLRQLKTWCRDYLALLARLKQEHPDQYWPSVMAIVDRKGMTMNNDLPGKIGVAWEHLVPDYPHMSMRNALMLGSEFSPHEVRFAPARHHPDDWVSVSMRDVEGEASGGTLPQLVPLSVVFGPHDPCFYCGQRSHAVSQCPSRSIESTARSVWPEVARLDFGAMRSSVAQIDKVLGELPDEETKIAALSSLLQEDSPATVMLRAFYDHTWPVQLRSVGFFWRARNKDLQKAADTLAAVDNNPLWDLLGTFRNRDSQAIDEELRQLQLKFSTDFKLHSLRGFWAAERGELDKAEKSWKEAERLSPHPVVQSWHMFLQARALECLGRFSQASSLYDQVSRACPGWYDAEYRRLVCMVKSGFTDAALPALAALIDRSGHFFNRALIDPELERGYIQVLARLYVMWNSMAARAREEVANLTRIRDELGTWFLPDNPFAAEVAARIDKILERSHIENYVAFQMLVTGRMRIERDIQAHVLDEARQYKDRFKANGARLKRIHEESAWFPFPKTLVEFNRSYNEGVANNNWALRANFHTPEAFRKAQMLMEQEGERLKKLEGRLKFLRIVRDSTLFVLTMTETFLWLEIVGLILIFAVLPLLIFYGDKMGLEVLANALAKDRWPVQKALLILLTVFAMGVAGLRTLLRFETVRDKILSKAREGRLKPGKRR
ncbi:MAG: tetratricopeptide repeat protein [Desulfovibrionaceae bacterium]|nr:tetratricopeptide repeat protein [Desulfovibrionaceae bacterium]